MLWNKTLRNVDNIKEINNLPYYSFFFVIRNLGSFKTAFFLLTLVRVLSTTAGFYATYLIGDILTNITTLTGKDVFFFYLPLYAGSKVLTESLDYITRRYGEALPVIYTDHLRVRFYKTFLNSNFSKIFNYSKERLMLLVNRYIDGVRNFLDEWVWATPNALTLLVIIMIILYMQSPFVLLFNIGFFSIFMLVASYLSKKYAVVESEYFSQIVKDTPVSQSLMLNVNTIKTQKAEGFFVQSLKRLLLPQWGKFDNIRKEHSHRWYIQLSLYNIVYALTFFYAIFQVVDGQLPLGFLILVKWSYDNLWGIVVHFINIIVGFIQQRENAIIVNEELHKILDYDTDQKSALDNKWTELHIENVEIEIVNKKKQISSISIPEFTVSRGDKIGVVGESGSGKSTLLNMLNNLVTYTGTYTVRVGKNVKDAHNMVFSNKDMVIVNNNDTLFPMSVKDNILFGKKVSDSRFDKLKKGLQLEKVIENTDAIIGDEHVHFSSGQLQRIRLMRGLINDSDIYLLDEPFNGIDKENKGKIMKFIKTFLKDKTVILVTHHEDELAIIDRKYTFKGNRLV